MGRTQDLGRRVELVPMDSHCSNITLGLYRQDQNGRPYYLFHTYSNLAQAKERVASLTEMARTLGGTEQNGGRLHFTYRAAHQAAARRLFLESAKLASNSVSQPRPLSIFDKKSGRNVAVTSLGAGAYEISADGPEEGREARIEAIVGGLKKLGEMSPVAGQPHRLAFSCAQPHDALVGLLLPRALNVRAILREEEMTSTRGVLTAPSQQK